MVRIERVDLIGGVESRDIGAEGIAVCLQEIHRDMMGEKPTFSSTSVTSASAI